MAKQVDLDRIDIELIRLLRKHARIANKDLAAQVGVAPSTALERVRRLRERGVISGFHAEVDPEAIGIGLQAMVAVRLVQHSTALVEAFHQHLSRLPEVLAYYHVAGADDYLVHVAVRDPAHLRGFLLAAFTQRPEVGHLETHLIFEFQRNPGIPIYRRADPD
ncbi:MAG: Lrp/AsnC family transcriptional regulator [Xanthomonadales bacterium]|nr:Lrp/AsnC family transcriptional regulator [Xanthomonadales bacterium]